MGDIMNARLFIFQFLLIFLGVCEFGSVQALELKPNSVEIFVGELAKIAVTKSSGSISVKSSNTSVATVTYASGIASIKGVKAGSTTVTVRDRKSSKRVEVKVISAPSPVLTISPAVLAVNVGGTATVTVTNASGTVNIQSSDNSIASVGYANNLATIKGDGKRERYKRQETKWRKES